MTNWHPGEWNSGSTERWRATFAPEAVAGIESPIEAEQDAYEFLAALGNQYELIGCAPRTSQVGEAASCEVESPNQFNTRLGLGPVRGNLYFEVVDGLIVRYDGHGFGTWFETVSAAWQDFRVWVGDKDVDDALAIGSFLGNAEGAKIALRYLDEYFQD